MGYPYPETPVSRPSPWKALIRVISEPAATFRDFGDRVPVFPGYLLQMALGLAGALMILPVTLRLMESTIINTPGYTPELATITRWSGIIGGALMTLAVPWIAGVFVALLGLFFGQFQESRVSFVSYLGMVGYARIPVALQTFLGGILALVMGEKAATLNLSLAALLPKGSNGMLVAFLTTINPFTIWYYCLLAIAFGALHRGKASRGLGLVLTLYVVLLLVSMAGAGIASRFGVPQM